MDHNSVPAKEDFYSMIYKVYAKYFANQITVLNTCFVLQYVLTKLSVCISDAGKRGNIQIGTGVSSPIIVTAFEPFC